MSTDDVGDALGTAAEAIGAADTVALACHVSPDGDALGSMLALHHGLRAAGRPSVASFPTPLVVAAHYRELPGLDLLTSPGDFPSEPDVMVTFDCGSVARLGDLEPAARAARELVVLDHHISNDRYGTINVIDPNAAATAVVVRRLMHELSLPLTQKSAVCLYAGLVCDTGRFQYTTTTPEVFRLAAELVGYGVPVESLSRTLFEEHRFAYLQLVADVLGRAELCADQRFVWASVTLADLERHDVTIDEAEGLIDLVRRTAEAEVACVLKEEPDGSLRVSLRSLGGVDVRLIAEREGGGGHRFAAGFTSAGAIPDVVARIRAAL
ncbi:MAG TPA: bifunctional oligoribonuclease/PAP phosphatase NrnA [Acidimicrobiia bacterium]|nr:bifunctional oligoribonuclease/PAP phosphatase NrnA [Acidimicrobiia bacterium]